MCEKKTRALLLQNLLRNVDRFKNSFCGNSKWIPVKDICKISWWFPAENLEIGTRSEWKEKMFFFSVSRVKKVYRVNPLSVCRSAKTTKCVSSAIFFGTKRLFFIFLHECVNFMNFWQTSFDDMQGIALICRNWIMF